MNPENVRIDWDEHLRHLEAHAAMTGVPRTGTTVAMQEARILQGLREAFKNDDLNQFAELILGPPKPGEGEGSFIDVPCNCGGPTGHVPGGIQCRRP